MLKPLKKLSRDDVSNAVLYGLYIWMVVASAIIFALVFVAIASWSVIAAVILAFVFSFGMPYAVTWVTYGTY